MFPCMSYLTGPNTVPRRSGKNQRYVLELKKKGIIYIINLHLHSPTTATKSVDASKNLIIFICPLMTDGKAFVFTKTLLSSDVELSAISMLSTQIHIQLHGIGLTTSKYITQNYIQLSYYHGNH